MPQHVTYMEKEPPCHTRVAEHVPVILHGLMVNVARVILHAAL